MALPSSYSNGTATVAAGSASVTGQGTFWSGKIRPGDMFGTHVGRGVRIAAVVSDTELTLAYPWSGAAQTATSYEIQITPDAARVQEQTRRLLEQLASSVIGDLAAAGTVNEALAVLGGAKVVATRADLKALPTATKSAILMEGIPAAHGRFGAFVWDETVPIATHQADTEEAIYLAPDSGAIGAWVRAGANTVRAEWAGAKGDGSTDNSVALQAAGDLAIYLGRSVEIGNGDFAFSTPVEFDLKSDVALSVGGRFGFKGAGSAHTSLRYTGTNGTWALSFNGPTWGTAGASAKLRVEGFTLNGGNYLRNGYRILRAIDVAVTDVNVIQCELAHYLEDVVCANYYSCVWTFNKNGIYAAPNSTFFSGPTPGSPPNEITFFGCKLSFMRGYGALFEYSAPVSFVGGTLESIGKDGVWDDIAATDRFGIKIVNGGHNGCTPLNIYGLHTESNAGTADIWIVHEDYAACVYNIHATDFFNNGTVNFVTNNIRLDTTGDSACVVNVNGCGFRGVNGYVPSAARRRIGLGTVVGNKHRINVDPSCIFDSDVDAPANVQGAIQTRRHMAHAWARLSTPGAVNSGSFNVSSVAKTGTGIYEVTFAKPLDTASAAAFANNGGAFGIAVVAGLVTDKVTIHTYDGSGTLADIAGALHVVVQGGQALNL